MTRLRGQLPLWGRGPHPGSPSRPSLRGDGSLAPAREVGVGRAVPRSRRGEKSESADRVSGAEWPPARVGPARNRRARGSAARVQGGAEGKGRRDAPLPPPPRPGAPPRPLTRLCAWPARCRRPWSWPRRPGSRCGRRSWPGGRRGWLAGRGESRTPRAGAAAAASWASSGPRRGYSRPARGGARSGCG